jgi:MFS family permease
MYDLSISVGSYFITLLALGSAGGVLLGGYLASKIQLPERIVTVAFTITAAISLLLAIGSIPIDLIPVLFIAIGFGYGVIAPSRDLLVRSVTPKGVAGRVYGIVYSGIDLGAAVGPFIFGFLMDAGLPSALFIGIALFQVTVIFTAIKVSAGATAKQAKLG